MCCRNIIAIKKYLMPEILLSSVETRDKIVISVSYQLNLIPRRSKSAILNQTTNLWRNYVNSKNFQLSSTLTFVTSFRGEVVWTKIIDLKQFPSTETYVSFSRKALRSVKSSSIRTLMSCIIFLVCSTIFYRPLYQGEYSRLIIKIIFHFIILLVKESLGVVCLLSAWCQRRARRRFGRNCLEAAR